MKSIEPTEHQIQSAFVQWCQLNEPRIPKLRLAFACPNGGVRSKITAANLKAESVRPGVPDWMCPASNGRFRGMAIEFKRPAPHRGHVTPSQREYIDLLRDEGWFVEVCYDTEEAIKMVERYFESR